MKEQQGSVAAKRVFAVFNFCCAVLIGISCFNFTMLCGAELRVCQSDQAASSISS